MNPRLYKDLHLYTDPVENKYGLFADKGSVMTVVLGAYFVVFILLLIII